MKPNNGAMAMASENQAPAEKPTLVAMNPVLLALACCGNSEGLDSLLYREDAQAQSSTMNRQPQEILDNLAASSSNCSNGSMAMQRASDDVEAFLEESLLEGVTVEGDTALHVVATYGDDDDFLSCANIIHSKAKHLLFVQNKKGDTPLHCAARAGKSLMVSHLIHLARCEDNSVNRVKTLLETENKLKETALHEAVRIRNNDIVKLLMEEDAETLYERSGGILSYSGPNGQNALHAAVLRGTVMTKMLLTWKKDLTEQADQNGSTPLHFAASLLHPSTSLIFRSWRPCPDILFASVLHANPEQLYQSDYEGLFPVHVAASVGAHRTLAWFLNKYPSSAGLRDAKGRTFLHVAVEKRKVSIVGYACRNRSLSWILNMRDNDGNTALHLAVQKGSVLMFCALFGNPQVDLNLTNEKGQTPRDISRYKIPQGLYYKQNSEFQIHLALKVTGTMGVCRYDHSEENYTLQVKYDERKEIETLKDSTQTLCIGSVLIATVMFGATFALPGGYRADDHTNGGTPTLAGRYTFDAFIMSNTLAFILFSMATIALMRVDFDYKLGSCLCTWCVYGPSSGCS